MGNVAQHYRRASYKAYKPSGIEWLGDVPCEWRLERLRFCIKTNPSKSEINDFNSNALVSFVPMEAVGEYGGLQLNQRKPLDEVANGYTYFRNGDVLVAKITPCFENGKGAIAAGLEKGVGFGTTELHVLRPDLKIDRRFLLYVTISHAFRLIGTSYMYGAGGQKRIPENFIKDFWHPLPSIDIQRVIAAFLDRETARIDALIEKKQRQIELLQEKRAALISHAVTKGLDPNVKMKDSGIEWLGEIPEHWRVCKVKYLATKIGSGKTPKGGAEVYIDSGIMLLRSQNVHFDGLRLDEVVFIDSDVDSEMASTRVKHGDVLLNITGASLGRCSLVNEEIGAANVNQHVCIIRARHDIVYSKYLYSSICSNLVQSQIYANENGTSREGLNFQQVGDLLVILPPNLDEQKNIASFINTQTQRIDLIIANVLQSIATLNEYRTALISAAVTGKIDVRENIDTNVNKLSTLYSIGYASHTLAEFFAILKLHRITAIADVRSQPYSRFPDFNREVLCEKLKAEDIEYVFLGNELGARREEQECYVNGQARYERISELPIFQDGINRLKKGIEKYSIALMCAEKEPLDCHRTILISRYLKNMGFQIKHILADGSVENHIQIEKRLVQRMKLGSDLFEHNLSEEELIERAYLKRGQEIAYTLKRENNSND